MQNSPAGKAVSFSACYSGPASEAERVFENCLGNYPRLVALKNEYDPTNLFRLNANVIPRV